MIFPIKCREMFLNKSRNLNFLVSIGPLLFQTNMVKIGLQLKAFLENCTGLTPEGEDFRLAKGGAIEPLNEGLAASLFNLGGCFEM